MGWSSPRRHPGPAAGFWGSPCPYPAGSPSLGRPQGLVPAPHPEQNRFVIVSLRWRHRCSAGDASGHVPKVLEGTQGFYLPATVLCLGKTLLAGEEEEDDGVGRTGEAVSSLLCKGEWRRRVVPTLPELLFHQHTKHLLPRPDGPVPSLPALSLGFGILRRDPSWSPSRAPAAPG